VLWDFSWPPRKLSDGLCMVNSAILCKSPIPVILRL
jgi:hypothetical protein